MFLLFVIFNVNFEDKFYYCFFVWNKIGEIYSNMIYFNVIGSKYYKFIVCYKFLIYYLDFIYFFLSCLFVCMFVCDLDVLIFIFVFFKEK